jgi:Protein of unknown function (DUF2848)
MTTLAFTLHSSGKTESISYPVRELVIAGWTGRDSAAVEHHIKELEEIGVPRPSSVPLFYRVGAELATQATDVQMLGADSSGEIEPVYFTYRGELWLTIGSDHTDRKVEAYSVAVSKQMCAKPIGRDAWRAADVMAHWDQLVIRSFIQEGGARVRYQDGPLAKLRTPADLIARYTKGASLLPEGVLMTGGTMAAIGGVRPAPGLAMELSDPTTGRTLVHEYRVSVLPVVS